MLESYYWKESIFRIEKRLQRWKKQRRWTERSICILERDALIAFFCIRKLIESHKLTDKCAGQEIKVIEYPWKGKRRVDRMNRHRIEELYRVGNGVKSRVSLSFAANQLIHSFILMTIFSDKGTPLAFLVSSDFQKNRKLIELDLKGIISAMHSVGVDRVSKIVEERNSKTGDMERVLTQ